VKGISFCFFIAIILGFYSCKTARRPVSSLDTEKGKLDSAQIKMPSVSITELPEIDTIPKIKPTDSLLVATGEITADSISIIGVGDIMMGTNFPGPEFLPTDSGRYLLSSVAEILQSADVTFGNLEGVLLNEGGELKNCNNPKACYLFRSPLYLASNLAAAGFDLLSVANNHAGDFGNTGRQSTARCLDSLQILYAGFVDKPFVLLELDKVTIGFTAFSPNTGTLSIHDKEKTREIVSHLDSISDIVIVSVHSGAEGAAYQHVTRENEIFFGEDRGNIYEFAHNVIDWGADVVFGHGPHVSRGIEVYKERFITYSLGNFCTYARFNLRGPNGFAPIMKILTDGQGRFISGNIIPVKQIELGYPVLDEDLNAITIIRELSKKDFPESPLIIGDSGNILYIQNQ
jgi:poly-gamma-glutamate capsule biosynthesis protein CapA/YwtB (metallophosphatase superfamily)